MEPAAIVVLAGAFVQTLGAFAGFKGLRHSGPPKGPSGQYAWMGRCLRKETSATEQKLFWRSIILGVVGWSLILGGMALS